MKLTDRFNDEIKCMGKTLKLNLSFDVVLRCHELLKDPMFNDMERIKFLWVMLVINHNDVDIDIAEKNKLVNFIFNNFIEDQHDPNQEVMVGPIKKSYDLEQDAQYIYASFLQDYNMDLFGMHGKLHWHKFKSLIGGLSENTKFKEVVSIRQQKIPAPTKYNSDERKRIIELKRVYRLKNDNDEQEQTKQADQALSSYSAGLKKEYYENKNK